jgi:ParB/RepB/Spo0J family partition protein
MTAALPPTVTAEHFEAAVPITSLFPSETNPRKSFDEQRLAELAKTIAEKGVLEPILARPHPSKKGEALEIVAGERRWRAAKIAKLATVPVIVRPLGDKDALEIQTIENAQREDLHPLEQAAGYERLIKDYGYTAESIADKIGKTRAHVFQIRKLGALSPRLREAFVADEMDTTLATVLARVPSAAMQEQAWQELKRQHSDGFSFRIAADFVRKNYMLDLGRAPFPIADATLVAKAGACGACPKRTGSQPDLFPDIKNGNVCTDPACFAAKRDAQQARVADKLEAKGVVVIRGAQAKKILPDEWSDLDSPEGGVVDPKATCWDDGKRRKWSELAKLAGVELAQLEDPRNGKFIPVVQVKAVREALQKKGVKLERSTRTDDGMVAYRAKQAATEKKNRLETEARRRTWLAIRTKVKRLEAKDLAGIAVAYWDEVWTDNQKRVLDVWGWPHGISDKALQERIRKLAPADLARFFVDLAIAPEIPVKAYYSNSAPIQLEAFGKRTGVQLARVRAALIKEEKLKSAAKVAAAKAKARKAPGKVKVSKPAKRGAK